jgi:hypothetical protein
VQAMFSLARTLDATEALLQRVAAARPGRNR